MLIANRSYHPRIGNQCSYITTINLENNPSLSKQILALVPYQTHSMRQMSARMIEQKWIRPRKSIFFALSNEMQKLNILMCNSFTVLRLTRKLSRILLTLVVYVIILLLSNIIRGGGINDMKHNKNNKKARFMFLSIFNNYSLKLLIKGCLSTCVYLKT